MLIKLLRRLFQSNGAGPLLNPAIVPVSQINIDTSRITGPDLPVAKGGTGISVNPSMLVNLGSTTAANVFVTAPRPGVQGVLPVLQGGTGVTSLAALKDAMGTGDIDYYGATNGWLKVGPIMLQWGVGTVPGGEHQIQFEFPVAFASQCRNVQLTLREDYPDNPEWLSASHLTRTGFQVDTWDSGHITGFQYLAIGY